MALKNSNIDLKNIPEEVKTCPESTKTAGLNTVNGDRAIQELNYGPAEQESECANCSFFDIASRMKKCTGESNKVGYCWKNHFECESENICDIYEEGGPIVNDEESFEMQSLYVEDALSTEPYEPNEEPVEERSPEVVEQPMQQQQVEMMQPQVNQQMPPQGMMPPQGQPPMGPPMQQPMMAYGGDLPKAQMGDWFSSKVNQAKNYASDKVNQAKDAYNEFDYTNTDLYQKGQKALDYGQDALSIAGMLPVIGNVADAVNTGISGARITGSTALGDTDAIKDNTKNLAWNAAAMIPGAGQAATAAKFASRIAKPIKNVANTIGGISNIHTASNVIGDAKEITNSFDAPSAEVDLIDVPEEQPLITRDGYELRRANKGLDGVYGYASPTKGSPYAGSPLANLLTFPHWSATMNLGSGSTKEKEYEPVKEINGKKVYYNKETGKYESELDTHTKTGRDYYQKLHEDNPDHFGEVKEYDANAQSIIYTTDDEANKVGSKAFKNNPEAQFINYNISDDGAFTFNAAYQKDDGSYDFRQPNTWTAQYESTVDKLKQFIPNYNPDDYRNVSKSGKYAYSNQDDQFQTYWNNYSMNDPYRAYEQMQHGGDLPSAQSKGEIDLNLLNVGNCTGGGCKDTGNTSAGFSLFAGAEGSNEENALLQAGLKGNLGMRSPSNIGFNLSGETGFQNNLKGLFSGNIDPSQFYKGKVSAGYKDEPLYMGYSQYPGTNLGAFAQYDSNQGLGAGVEGGFGPLNLQAGYNFDTQSPFFGGGLTFNLKEGGELTKAQKGLRSKYKYDPYNIPRGGNWKTVTHGTKAPKWNQTEDWQTDKQGNEFWNLDGDEAQKWLRGRAKYLTEELSGSEKYRFSQMLSYGEDMKFQKWTNPQGKEEIIIQGRGNNRIYIPANSSLGQLTPSMFNEFKSKSRGSYVHLSHPFYDQIAADGPRTKEQKQIDFDYRNTPYQTEIKVGSDNRTRGGWLYSREDKPLTYNLTRNDMTRLPGSLQQKYRLNSKGAKLIKDPITGDIKVTTDGKGSFTIQVDDLKWFQNPGRLGESQSDPAFGRGDNLFDYLNNQEWEPNQRYEDIDLEKIKKQDHRDFMRDVRKEAKKFEEKETEKSKEYFKKNPWRIKEIKEDPEEEEVIEFYDPSKTNKPVIPSMPTVTVDGNTDVIQKQQQHAQNIWAPVYEDLGIGASKGNKNVSSKITNSAANAITQAYQTGKLGDSNYGNKDLQRDLNMYKDAYGEDNYNKLRTHLGISKYGSELSRYAQMGKEFSDQTEVAQHDIMLHHEDSIARSGRELPKAQVNISNQNMYGKRWSPDQEDPFNFSSGIQSDYITGLGLNMNSNSILDSNNEYKFDASGLADIRQNQYYEENPHLVGVPNMQDLKEGVDAGNQVQEDLNASDTPTPNPQAQFTEFMDESAAMTNKNDFSQLTDEERKALEEDQNKSEEDEEGPGIGNAFAAVASDIVGLAQGVINPAFEAKEAREIEQEKYKYSADDNYSASATTKGTDPFQGGADTIYQDTDYGTNVKRGKEIDDVVEIDMETYRKLIAAGADIEII